MRDVPEVLLIRYERLISETEAVIEDVCRFAGLPFSREMIDRRAEAASTVVATGEPWKEEALAAMRTVAEDSCSPDSRDSAREPTGWPSRM